MLKFMPIILVICFLITPSLHADDEEFILGLWHCWNNGRQGGCYYPSDSTCNEADTMWGDDTLSTIDKQLIEGIHARRCGEIPA